jgi:accessory gene regulator B
VREKMHAFCVKIARYLAIRTGQPNRQDVLTYGLEVLLGDLMKFIILFTLAGLSGIFPTTFLATVSTVCLRLISGGKHASSHLRCLITTLAVFLCAGWLADILLPQFTGDKMWWIIIPAFMYLLLAVYLWVPLENEQRKFNTPEKRKKFRLLSFMLVTIWFFSAVAVVIFITNSPFKSLYLSSTTVGLLVQAFLISPWSVKLQEALAS